MQRLSLIEDDLRGLDTKLDKRIESLDAKLDSKLHLVVGLILASWFSTLGAFLLR